MPRRTLSRPLAVAALTAVTAVVPLAVHGTPSSDGGHRRDGDLARTFTDTTRSTVWKRVDALRLGFDTFHPQGLVVTQDRIYLSSVEIIVPPVKNPDPSDGYDRTPGKGRGHLFVMDRTGRLLKDVALGEGDSYHPGGISTDGRNIWVSVAEYRPNSHAIVYKIPTATLRPQRMFEVDDHVGGIVYDPERKLLVGNTWGSRRFYAWTTAGRQRETWLNPSHLVDYQDCTYAARSKALCSGVTELPQRPGSIGTYELGGLALVDLRTHAVTHEIPFQQFSTGGHVATRNPVDVHAKGRTLTMYAAPDDSHEGVGTQLLTYTAEVPR
ncbi:DUF6454 family protein [Solicola sp. PLA-1-18]|uniref:DUF6454 family protein n=1 Tax=Solicola sp. PLA-1-18 TaxID=3380532 RepID=UPI003B7A9E86